MIRNIMYLFIFMELILSLSLFATDNINIDHLSTIAKKENKHLLLFFHKDGCSFCEKMLDVTLNDDKIEDVIDEKFLFVDIGINDVGSVIYKDFNGSKHDYAKSLEIGFYPTIGFVDANNTLIYGAIGYHNIQDFNLLLKYIYNMEYKAMELEEFKDKLEFEEDES